MGADIHVYVEYELFKTAYGPYWDNLTTNYGHRDYHLFGLLAGVRGSDGPIFDPRGLPKGRLSWRTENDHWVRVNDEIADHEGWTSTETAERWVGKGQSVAERAEDGTLIRVSNPDYHSHSWLTASELETVLGRYAEKEGHAPVEWQAVLAGMKTFEAAGRATRVVFWFDN